MITSPSWSTVTLMTMKRLRRRQTTNVIERLPSSCCGPTFLKSSGEPASTLLPYPILLRQAKMTGACESREQVIADRAGSADVSLMFFVVEVEVVQWHYCRFFLAPAEVQGLDLTEL